ncbi:oxidoreductase [Serratia microhaemolytica]|uniref:oxidoreductase n=1 Tax=Serratia microhaemolytica TaxID=2675110 RepID=UPI000FDECEFA|nr:oxidoreductase [Serratia microhaemolytica]
MVDKIRVALLGYGNAGKTFHAPLIAATPGMELTAIASSSADKVHSDWPAIQVVNDVRWLFDDRRIDLIVIATPNDSHFALAQQALAAGKHVVVDKPFTVTLSQAEQLKQLAEREGKLLSVFHNRRWDSDFLTLKTLLAQGTLGEVVYFESHFDRYRPEVRTRWREQAGDGSGIWYDLAPHLLDQALQLFGMPETLFVDFGCLRQASSATDYFHALLKYPQSRVVLHSTLLAAAETPRYLVHGTHGSYIKYGFDPQEAQLKMARSPAMAQFGHDPQQGIVTLSQNGQLTQSPYTNLPGNYLAYYTAIANTLHGRGTNPVTVEQAIAVMKLLELGIYSAKQQRPYAV